MTVDDCVIFHKGARKNTRIRLLDLRGCFILIQSITPSFLISYTEPNSTTILVHGYHPYKNTEQIKLLTLRRLTGEVLVNL